MPRKTRAEHLAEERRRDLASVTEKLCIARWDRCLLDDDIADLEQARAEILDAMREAGLAGEGSDD
jgi:hypothetical protein